jgi:hypothetical protein
MTRGALTLLLVLTSWLSSLPELRAATALAPAAVVAVSHDEALSGEAPEHVAAQSATPQVPCSPVMARLPALPLSGKARCQGRQIAGSSPPQDLRAELRRVQTRRRLPRLGGDPPWP